MRSAARTAIVCAIAAITVLSALSAQTQHPWPSDLLARDRAVSRLAGSLGLDSALASGMADDGVSLLPGAPMLRGRAATLAALGAQPSRDRRVQWDPVYVEVANDGRLAVMYGTTTSPPLTPDSAGGQGRFIAAWRKSSQGTWELVALCLTGWPPARSWTQSVADTQSRALAPAPRDNPYAAADYEFAARAAQSDVSAAFEAVAASDAVMVGSQAQPLVRGPEAIGQAFRVSGATHQRWSWWPVVAAGDLAGAVGFTIGEAEVRGPGADGREQIAYTKYMTLWRRESDGRIRMTADGGTSRPPRQHPEE